MGAATLKARDELFVLAVPLSGLIKNSVPVERSVREGTQSVM